MGPTKVLVLNQDYSAINICSIPKAIVLLFLQKAEIVHADDMYHLRSVDNTYPMPSIIRLSSYVNVPYRNGVVLNRQNIFKRDNGECQYCGSKKDLTLDHVIPRSRNGRSTWKNLVTACKSCNSRKGNRTPEEAKMKLKRTPYKPSFLMYLRDFNGKVHEEWDNYLGNKNASFT